MHTLYFWPKISISKIITQLSIYRVIVYFLLCHESLNYWPVNIFDYWLALYHGLVTPSAVKTHRPLSTFLAMMCVWFVYERRRYATIMKKRHGLATLNSNNSVVYGQKHKVWVLVFSVRRSRTFWDQNLADLVKFSVLQQNRIVYSNSLQGTLQSISSNGSGNKTVISVLYFVV